MGVTLRRSFRCRAEPQFLRAIQSKWSVNGEASYGAALASNAGSNYAVKGTVGLRYRW